MHEYEILPAALPTFSLTKVVILEVQLKTIYV
jgi:hypothetical protein